MNDLESRLRRALSPERHRLGVAIEADGALGLSAPAAVPGLRPAAVLAPILNDGSGLRMLLTRRSAQMRAHQGQVAFPGGRRDPGDASLIDTALREAEEEIGLDRRHVEVLGLLDDHPTTSGFIVTPVVGLIHGRPGLRGHEAEVAEIFEVPLELLLEPANYRRERLVRDGRELAYYELSYAPQRIWGATAGMLFELCQRMQQVLV